MSRISPKLACLELAAGQFGAFAREQALAVEMTPRAIGCQLESGEWRSPQRGVYVVSGAPASWEQRVMVAQLRGGPSAVLSHLTAAHLHGLYHLRPLVIDLTRRGPIDASGIRVHRSEIGPADVCRLGPFSVTSPARTLIDLSGVLDFDRLEDCLEEALFHGTVDLAGLNARLTAIGSRGRKGTGSLKRLLELRDPRWAPTATRFETLLHRVLREAGLPLPQRQISIFEGREFVTRIDFAYLNERVGIPADSFKWHTRRKQWELDIVQRNRLTRMGWRLRPTTWTELKRRPADFTRDIAQLLATQPELRRVLHA
jgi:hypothetical protein